MRHYPLLLTSLLVACSGPIDQQRVADSADLATPATAPTDSITETLNAATKAAYEAYEKLTPTDTARNHEIERILQEERLAVITAGLPEWVKNRVTEFEGPGESDYGYAYSRSVAWGTGTYKGQAFWWFAHTNSDPWLQMDLSIKIDSSDVDLLNGLKPGDVERAPSDTVLIGVSVNDGSDRWSSKYIQTHFGLTGPITWTEKYCTKPSQDVCDTAGAFEEYLLSVANKALPGKLTFVLRGRIPR